MGHSRFLLPSFLVMLAAGCGSTTTSDGGIDASPPHDAGLTDSGGHDGGPTDASSLMDATDVDAGRVDGGDLDAGSADAGGTDAGAADAGSADAGSADAGSADAGSADAGGADGGSVGDTCRHDSDCMSGLWCAIPDGSCGGDGLCAAVPSDCVGVPMANKCGCDGITHTSACDAHLHRTSVAHNGACTCPTTVPVGCCFSNAGCASGLECRTYGCPSVGASRAGVCEPPTTGFDCWDDRDCGGGAICSGANVCPCGASCLVADSPGTCMTL